MSELTRRTGEVNGIRMHWVEQGTGPLVLLCHGFPESWYWGAPVAWYAALMRPDRFRAVIGLSVPFRPRAPAPPTRLMPAREVFYQLYSQAPAWPRWSSSATCARHSSGCTMPPRAMRHRTRPTSASRLCRGKAASSPTWQRQHRVLPGKASRISPSSLRRSGPAAFVVRSIGIAISTAIGNCWRRSPARG